MLLKLCQDRENIAIPVESYIIKTKFEKKSIKKSNQKTLKIARAHELPIVNKSFERVPSSQPITERIGSTHYNVRKYFAKPLNPLTQNKYSLKDTFDASERIKKIPKELISNDM